MQKFFWLLPIIHLTLMTSEHTQRPQRPLTPFKPAQSAAEIADRILLDMIDESDMMNESLSFAAAGAGSATSVEISKTSFGTSEQKFLAEKPKPRRNSL